jgi:hypothetical protein
VASAIVGSSAAAGVAHDRLASTAYAARRDRYLVLCALAIEPHRVIWLGAY